MSQAALLPATLRAACEDDAPLVLSSWLKSARMVGDARLQSNEVYFAGKRAQIIRVLNRQSTRLLVACDVQDERHIYGWTCAELGVLHYVYVKLGFRGFKVARWLVHGALERFGQPDVDTITTSLCRDFEALAPKFRLVFNPYLLEART